VKDVEAPDYEYRLSERQDYLERVVSELREMGITSEIALRPGHIADVTKAVVGEKQIDMVVTSTSGKSGSKHWQRGGVSRKLMGLLEVPVLLVQVSEMDVPLPSLDRILVSLDGSIFSERVLPYARTFAETFNSELILISVPQVPEVADYRAASNVIESIRTKATGNMTKFLHAIARDLAAKNGNIKVRTLITGSRPARTIVSVGEEEKADMVMLTSQGRGGLDLFMMGSVAQDTVAETSLPVFMVPIIEEIEKES
jgi:nucleotide-binding universal stress UspA family protein